MIPLLLLLFAAADPGGYLAAKWGMTPDEVLATLPQATRHAGPDATKPFRGALTAIIIKEITVAEVPMQVNFRFGETSGRLEEVYLQPLKNEHKDLFYFNRIEALLVQKYGRAWTSTDPTVQVSQWITPSTVIRLTYSPPRLIPLRSLTIEYRPRVSSPPI